MSFVRVAAASMPVHVGNVQANVQEILGVMEKLRSEQVSISVFPELCLTGATLGDWLGMPELHRQVSNGLEALIPHTTGMTVIVGLPVCEQGRVYNCAAVLSDGRMLGRVYKTRLTQEEERWFCPGSESGTIFASEDGSVLFSVDIGESRSERSCADLILNPSAARSVCGSHAALSQELSTLSRRLCAGYVHACAGFGESTTDHVFDGATAIWENGQLLAQGPRFSLSGGMAIADVDVEGLRFQRQRTGWYRHAPEASSVCAFKVEHASAPLLRPLSRLPFVPENLEEIAQMQCIALATRLRAIRGNTVVLGVSGGLDSTLALLAAAKTFDLLGLKRSGIHALSLPGMATGERTHTNAHRLMEKLGVTMKEIPIGTAVRQHFADIGHDGVTTDITYENSQARERTQILMDYANRVGGIVLGTGDLSEIALGFCTFGADHLSMYNVNASVPKTLVRALTTHLSREMGVQDVCADIIATPISPELTPGQQTEDILGSYELHDFFLWHMMHSGAGRKKLLMLAQQAFAEDIGQEDILRALDLFLRRFRTQQFKRSCMPDGAQVTEVSLSPRGGWTAPSDL